MKIRSLLFLLVAANAAYGGPSKTPMQPYITTPEGDYISPDEKGGADVARLQNGTTRVTEIHRYRGNGGYPYALSLDVPGRGDIPVFIKTQPEFQKWLDKADVTPGWDWCLIVPAQYSAWTPTAPIPTSCGTHTYTEEQTCIDVTTVDSKACPLTPACTTQTRQQTVDNGSCGPAPTVNITAPPSAPANSDFNVTWTSSDASSCTTSTNISDNSLSGTRTFNYPSPRTVTYEVTCTSPGGTDTDSVTVQITNPITPPTVTLTLNKSSVTTGETFNASWVSTDATSCNSVSIPGVNATAGNTNSSYSTSGSRNITVTCTGPGGTGSDTESINVTQSTPPPTVSVNAPSSATAGDWFTVYWSSTNATSCWSSSVRNVSSVSGNSSNMISSAGGRYLYVYCSGPGGTADGRDYINITAPVPPRPTVSVNAPSSAQVNQSFSVSWSSTNATSCSSPDFPVSGTSGSRSVSFSSAGTRNFRVTCTGGGGNNTGSDSTVINAPAPPAPTVTVNAPPSANTNTPFNVSWSSTNTTNCASADLSGVSATSGTRSISYSSPGSKTIRVTCVGPGGNGAASDTVVINAPAVMCPTTRTITQFGLDFGVRWVQDVHGALQTKTNMNPSNSEFTQAMGRPPQGAESGFNGIVNLCGTLTVRCNNGTWVGHSFTNQYYCSGTGL